MNKLLLYDKFWDAFIKLPKNVQKSVVEFQKKFRDNSKSAAIHLEPISTFKDASLRTARISNAYRAVIKAPESGNTYYLLWVDNHDDAYEWAENKLFRWNEHTQSMQVFTAPEAIQLKEKEAEAPVVAVAGLYQSIKEEQLLRLGIPEVLLPSVRGIESLTDLESLEEYIPRDVFENLFYLADGANLDQLIWEVEEGKLETELQEEQIASINNKRNFIELTDDHLFNEALAGHLDRWKYYLHPSQAKLVEKDFSGTVKITGGAGTGKTVAAMHRLKYLSENRKSGEKIFFTTFTKALTENLRTLIKGMGVVLDNIEIQNIDAWAFQQSKKWKLFDEDIKVFGLNAVKTPEEVWEQLLETNLVAFDGDFLLKEYQDVILYHNVQSLAQYIKTSRIGRGKPLLRKQRKEVWKWVEQYESLKEELGYYHKEEIFNKLSDHLEGVEEKPFDYCLVDELQDFSNVELRLLRAIVPVRRNDLFFVGDPLQKIYAKKINFSSMGINVRGRKSHRLRINYRTSEEIKKLAVSIIKDCQYDDFDGEQEDKNGYVSLFHGTRPTYKMYKTKKDEIVAVLDQINELVEQGENYASMVISARTREGVKDFQSAMHNGKVPYYKLESGKWHGNPTGVRLMTFHSIKGLEFQQVFLVDINVRNCPKLPYDFGSYREEAKEQYLKQEKSLLYVAVSRAIKLVVVSGVGEKSELVDL